MTFPEALALAAVLLGLPGAIYGYITVRSVTRNDRERAAEAVADKISEARADERRIANEARETERRQAAERIAELTADRDYQRKRADDLADDRTRGS